MYEVIEKNEYGVLVRNKLKNSPKCTFCKYDKKPQSFCNKICNYFSEFYYLPDQEAAKLETEISPETFTINDMYVTSKQLFDCQDELKDSQKELIDLQIENKQLKESIKELGRMVLTGFVCTGDEDNCPSYMEGKKRFY